MSEREREREVSMPQASSAEDKKSSSDGEVTPVTAIATGKAISEYASSSTVTRTRSCSVKTRVKIGPLDDARLDGLVGASRTTEISFTFRSAKARAQPRATKLLSRGRRVAQLTRSDAARRCSSMLVDAVRGGGSRRRCC